MLFLLFVNDLPDSVTSGNVATFADDTKVFKVVNSCDDVLELHSDLNRLGSCADNMGLSFNSKKCKVMHITRKRKPPESAYHLGGSPLVYTKTEKDLGVWISDNLYWSKQVSEACSRANRPLGFVRTNSRTMRNARIRHTYIHTSIHTYIHTYIHTCFIKHGNTFSKNTIAIVQ